MEIRKIFEGVLPYMGLAAILVKCQQCRQQIFIPPTHRGSTQNLALTGEVVSKGKMFENGLRRMDDGRTPEHGYTISTPSGELKSKLYCKCRILILFLIILCMKY